MPAEETKTPTLKRLPWEFWVYQTLAVLAMIPPIVIAGLYLLTYPQIEAWFLSALIVGFNALTAFSIIFFCSRNKAGRDFRMAWIISLYASRTSSALKLHRYIVSLIILMFAFPILLASGIFFYTPLREPMTLLFWFVFGISGIYTFRGHFTKSPTSTESSISSPQSQQ